MPLILGQRKSKGSVDADQLAKQLREDAVPGHRDFVSTRKARLNPIVIGSFLHKPVSTAISSLGRLLRIS